MNYETINQFLNEEVKILFDVGNSYTYTYRGKLTNINSDDCTIIDQKVGQLILKNSNIIQISKLNNGGSP